MNSNNLTKVCRICPNASERDELYNIFDETLDLTYNLKEVILVTTGVKIIQNDLISTKICKKCCNITLKMFQFRQDALKQDQALKDMLNQYLENEGLKLPNTCITLKKEKTTLKPVTLTNVEQCTPSTSKETIKKTLHPSVADLYKKYPGLKLATRCLEKDISPFVSLMMGDVESYFENRQLDMRKFVYRPHVPRHTCNAVAKKKTSVPTKPKTVSPIKIRLKCLQPPEAIQNNSVCAPLPKKRGRKRKIPLTENDQCSKSKVINRNIEPVSKSTTIHKNKTTTLEIDSTPGVADPIGVSISEPTISGTTAQIKESSDKSSYISETTRTTSTNKPEFVESLGLTPRIYTKSQKLFVCNVCGSVHNSGIELKWHSRQHMVCQFCKRKCKSIDAKENHVNNLCKVKRIMNSPGPIVALEKVHLNLDVRKKYMDAFSSFELIPGLIEPAPLERVLLDAASPPPYISADGIIVLSDDDNDDYESSAGSTDPLSGISTSLAGMSPSGIKGAVYNSVAQLRPDIKIKNNTIFDHVVSRISDKEIVKDLIKIVRPEQPSTCDQILQTNLPDNSCIKIKNVKGTCEFKNLKEHLMFYKIPIKVTHGVFKVSYQLTENSAPKKSMEFWNDLTVIDHYKSRTPKSTNTSSKGNNVAYQNKSIADSCKSDNIAVLNAQGNSTSNACSSAPSTVSTTRTSIPCPKEPVSNGTAKSDMADVNLNVASFVRPPDIIPTTSENPTNTSEACNSEERQKERNASDLPKLPIVNKMKPTDNRAVLNLEVNSIMHASFSTPVTIPTTAKLSSNLCHNENIETPNGNEICLRPNVSSHKTLSKGGVTVLNSQVCSTSIANINFFSPATIPTATSVPANLPSFSNPNYSISPTNSIDLRNVRIISHSVANTVTTPTTSNQVLNSPSKPTYTTPISASSFNPVSSKSVFQATNNPGNLNSTVRNNSLVFNKPMHIPRTYSKTVLSNNTAANTYLNVNNSNVKSPILTDANIESGTSSNANNSSINRSDPSASVIQPPSVIKECFSTTSPCVRVPPPAINLPPSTNILKPPPPLTAPVKFRVKKVWELQ